MSEKLLRLLSYLASLLSGWNSVKRKLPRNKSSSCTLGILCFTLIAGYYPAVCMFSTTDEKWYTLVDNRDVTKFVTHWKLASKVPVIFFYEWNHKSIFDKTGERK